MRYLRKVVEEKISKVGTPSTLCLWLKNLYLSVTPSHYFIIPFGTQCAHTGRDLDRVEILAIDYVGVASGRECIRTRILKIAKPT